MRQFYEESVTVSPIITKRSHSGSMRPKCERFDFECLMSACLNYGGYLFYISDLMSAIILCAIASAAWGV